MSEIKNTTIQYRRGLFVLAQKLPTGKMIYYTFKYGNQNMQKAVSGSHLAIFNELLYANWYLVTAAKKPETETTNNFSLPGEFYVIEITGQDGWNRVCDTVIAENSTIHDAMLNPCEGDGKHLCPIVRFELKDYSDLTTIKNAISKCPDKHYTIAENNNAE